MAATPFPLERVREQVAGVRPNEQGKVMTDGDPDESNFPLGVQPHVYGDDDDETGLSPAHPASTLVVFHERDPAGPPHLLMVRRSQAMKFAAGAAVFPGGRVDADDHHLAQDHAAALGIAPADAAARIAAIRETIEETGLGVGLSTRHDAAALAAMRTGLLAETPLSVVLSQHQARLDLAALVPFTRWRPNFAHARTFDTRFYLTRVDEPIPRLSVMPGENSALFWLTAQDALDRADVGDIDLIFPTRRNLERLALFQDFAGARDSARQFPPRRITPFVVEEDGRRYLCIRDDCGYPVTRETIDSAMRG
jgi:8-oxo-dGTP pyrophosphatase MutT (NUDIX family)